MNFAEILKYSSVGSIAVHVVPELRDHDIYWKDHKRNAIVVNRNTYEWIRTVIDFDNWMSREERRLHRNVVKTR